MMDIGKDLQDAYAEGYKQGRFDESMELTSVVRCRECNHWNDWGNGTGSCHRSEVGYNWFGVDATDYCSFGERREDGEA